LHDNLARPHDAVRAAHAMRCTRNLRVTLFSRYR